MVIYVRLQSYLNFGSHTHTRARTSVLLFSRDTVVQNNKESGQRYWAVHWIAPLSHWLALQYSLCSTALIFGWLASSLTSEHVKKRILSMI